MTGLLLRFSWILFWGWSLYSHPRTLFTVPYFSHFIRNTKKRANYKAWGSKQVQFFLHGFEYRFDCFSSIPFFTLIELYSSRHLELVYERLPGLLFQIREQKRGIFLPGPTDNLTPHLLQAVPSDGHSGTHNVNR